MPKPTPTTPPEPEPTPTSARSRRLSLSEILELVLTRSDHSSVTLSRTAAGETAIEVKVRPSDGDDGEAPTVADAARVAKAVYDELRTLYPTSPRSDDGDVTLTRNAKGEVQVALSVETVAGRGDTLDGLLASACERFDTILARYPLSSGYTRTPPSSDDSESGGK